MRGVVVSPAERNGAIADFIEGVLDATQGTPIMLAISPSGVAIVAHPHTVTWTRIDVVERANWAARPAIARQEGREHGALLMEKLKKGAEQ